MAELRVRDPGDTSRTTVAAEDVIDFEDHPDLPHRLEASYRNLDRVLGSVTMADNKALIALTFQGAIVAGLALIAGTLKDALQKHSAPITAWVIGILLVAFFGCFCMATLRLFQSISPRLHDTAHNDEHPSFLFFFGGIAGMQMDRYVERMRNLTPRQIHEGLVTVTHTNARIAAQKFRVLRVAYKYLGLQMVFYVAIVLLSVLPLTR